MLVKLEKTLLCILYILGLDRWIETFGVGLSLHNQAALQVHETMQSFILLDLEHQDVGIFLCGTQLERQLASIISRLNSEVIKLTLFLLKGVI